MGIASSNSSDVVNCSCPSLCKVSALLSDFLGARFLDGAFRFTGARFDVFFLAGVLRLVTRFLTGAFFLVADFLLVLCFTTFIPLIQ